MAKDTKKKAGKDGFEGVETALTSTEGFIEEHKKPIMYAFIGLLVVMLLIVGYINLIRKPKVEEAYTESFMAEYYFGDGQDSLALYGDGTNMGFVDIIDEYGSTPMGNAARYYAGVCYLHMHLYDDAIDVLDEFSSDDPMIGPLATALIGDANLELGNTEIAAEKYIKAANDANNNFLTPAILMKAGKTYELLDNYQKALECYQRIENEYFGTTEQVNIERYIKRAELKLAK